MPLFPRLNKERWGGEGGNCGASMSIFCFALDHTLIHVSLVGGEGGGLQKD